MQRTVLLLSIFLVACQTSAPKPKARAAVIAAPSPTPKGKSVKGQPLDVHVFGRDDAPTVLFLASIHGDETAGTTLMETWAQRLFQDPTLTGDRRVVLVPVVNPDGVELGTRRNAKGVDLNRNFPAKSFRSSRVHGGEPLSEPESRFVYDLIRHFRPERIISFHQPGNCLDFDGPAIGLVHRMAADSPLSISRLGTRSGSLGAWAGKDTKIAVVTVELPRDADDLGETELWELYGNLFANAVR